jgi:hypothetical protein
MKNYCASSGGDKIISESHLTNVRNTVIYVINSSLTITTHVLTLATYQRLKNVSGYDCNLCSLRTGNETLRQNVMGNASVWTGVWNAYLITGILLAGDSLWHHHQCDPEVYKGRHPFQTPVHAEAFPIAFWRSASFLSKGNCHFQIGGKQAQQQVMCLPAIIM